eukprot:TRINITY_DN13981_c0_g1_i1.p1 TRINITY_DN13981_c0_g1~~TRINITY_DN13981_c0_g1_i1.p1  ORF type:complete len:715 (+),score=128.69 TRINITY_DN13981_c0_g1_i1:64-2145(+)
MTPPTIVVIDMVHDFVNANGVFANVFGKEDTAPIRESAATVAAMLDEYHDSEVILISSKYLPGQFKNVPGVCSTPAGQAVELLTTKKGHFRTLFKYGNSVFDQQTASDTQFMKSLFYNKTIIVTGATIPACVQATVKDLRSCCAHIIIPTDCVSCRASSITASQRLLTSWSQEPDITVVPSYKSLSSLPSTSCQLYCSYPAGIPVFATSMFLIQKNCRFEFVTTREGSDCILVCDDKKYEGQNLFDLLKGNDNEEPNLSKCAADLWNIALRFPTLCDDGGDDDVVKECHKLITILKELEKIVQPHITDIVLVSCLSYFVYIGFPLTNALQFQNISRYWLDLQTDLVVKKATPVEWRTEPLRIWKKLMHRIVAHNSPDAKTIIESVKGMNTVWDKEACDEIGLYTRAAPLQGIGSGDSKLFGTCISDGYSQPDFYQKLQNEINWHTMYHRGGEVPRLVSIQGDVTVGGLIEPCYRHPADYQPKLETWSPTVMEIKKRVEEITGTKLNHVLIQKYRTGCDYISPHADKTLDIERGSDIINVSFGASRVMTLTSKKDVPVSHRSKQQVELTDNSIFVLGWETNKKFVHGIRPDKRPLTSKKRPAHQKLESGSRISFTFRTISSFMYRPTRQIFGQGSPYKSFTDLPEMVIPTEGEEVAMLKAFGNENNNSNFDWDVSYGKGFTVMNLAESDPLENS